MVKKRIKYPKCLPDPFEESVDVDLSVVELRDVVARFEHPWK
jgi:hypothetical protein